MRSLKTEHKKEVVCVGNINILLFLAFLIGAGIGYLAGNAAGKKVQQEKAAVRTLSVKPKKRSKGRRKKR